MNVVLNDYSSRSFCMNAIVSIGSILAHTLFLIFTNLLADISFQLSIYTDDATINTYLINKSDRLDKVKLGAGIKNALQSVVKWCK